MPAHRIGIAPMTAAARQARHRAKLRQHSRPTPPAALRRVPPRPTRWATAVAALIDLQDDTAPGSTLYRPILKDRGWQRSC
ncbi:MAG TPA: hypothetical protein VEQ62_07050 [Stellaceae bacterium]|nr:hypothetical protein [Stellaceae bacterium]